MKIKLLLIIICITIAVLILISTSPKLTTKPEKETLINFFYEKKDLFHNIVDYYESIEEGRINIDKRLGKTINDMTEIITENGRKTYIIKDKNIKEDIEALIFKYGFVGIFEDQDYVYFYKVTGFQWYQAIIYSKTGKEPFLNKTREYQEIGDGWHYYSGE